jgi:glycosyltransferase involved in cell wall biosynthesis
MLRSFMACNVYENFEWILIDHGSTDGTIRFLSELRNDPEFESIADRIRIFIFDEKAYIARLKDKGISLNGGRRIGEGFYGYYRNKAKSLSKGDYFIDIADDHQFIRKGDWVSEMIDIYKDREKQDDIGALVFRTRLKYRALKKNNMGTPAKTKGGIEYLVCDSKGYDDYQFMSKESYERLGPMFSPDQIEEQSEKDLWNDESRLEYDSRHYKDYLKRTKELGLKKVMMKYPYTHDLLNDKYNQERKDLVAPIVDLSVLKKEFGDLNRCISIEEMNKIMGV